MFLRCVIVAGININPVAQTGVQTGLDEYVNASRNQHQPSRTDWWDNTMSTRGASKGPESTSTQSRDYNGMVSSHV